MATAEPVTVRRGCLSFWPPVFAGAVIVISSGNFSVSLAGEGPPANHIPELYGRVLQSPVLVVITTGIVMLWLLALASAVRESRRINLAQQKSDPPPA